MPRIIPVLDVLRGQAVHAIEGRREDYRPLRSSLRRGSDPLALAQAIREAFGPAELYLADLDAIAGSAPDVGLYRAIAGLGLATWIDAGVADERRLGPILEAGAGRVIAGLETVAGRGAVRRVVEAAGQDRAAFSLDLRDGRPILAPGAAWGSDDPREIVVRAIEAGIRSVILLDLARVGTGRGVGTVALLRELKVRHPGVEWLVGGGIASPGQVEELGWAGASAVLVGSAIHDGRIAPADAVRLA